MRKSLLALGVLLVAFNAGAASTKKAPAAKTINCSVLEFQDDGEEAGNSVETAKVSVRLDNLGIAELIQVKRTPGPISLLFDDKFKFSVSNENDLITHGIRPNRIEEVDEATGEKTFAWNIKRVEFVTAENSKGDKIELIINDHSYAGPVGSTLNMTVGGKALTTDNVALLFCKGDIKIKD